MAVIVTVSPYRYKGWSGDFTTLPLPMMAMLKVQEFRANWAVTLVFFQTGTMTGFAVVVVSPVQPVKCHPVEGVAVSVTKLPARYVGWSGDLPIVPEPDTAVVTV